MDFSLFLPETYLILVALFFFVQSMWKSSAKMNQRLAFVLSAVGVLISIYSLDARGDLFHKAYRVDLFSQVFKFLLSLGLFLIIFLGQKLKGIEESHQPEFFMFLFLSSLGLMIMVSIGTFSWDSIRKLREHPPSSSLVMLSTVVVTVFTHDLAKGVFSVASVTLLLLVDRGFPI